MSWYVQKGENALKTRAKPLQNFFVTCWPWIFR